MYKDRSEEQWHKDLTDFNSAEKSTTPNPISAVITTTRYNLRWHSKKNYNADYAKYSNALKDLRMKNGMGGSNPTVCLIIIINAKTLMQQTQ